MKHPFICFQSPVCGFQFLLENVSLQNRRAKHKIKASSLGDSMQSRSLLNPRHRVKNAFYSSNNNDEKGQNSWNLGIIAWFWSIKSY